MKNKNMKMISMLMAVIIVMGLAVGCGTKKDTADTKMENTSKVEKLNEHDIKDTYTGIDDVYVLKDATDIDYLDWVLYDTSIVKDIKVDNSKIDTSKEGTYKLTYKVTVDRATLENNQSKTDSKSKTKKTSATETVNVTKNATVVNKDKAQELADNNEVVYSGKGETVKKSDGSTVTAAQEAPASTATTGGSVVKSSNKEEVKPEATAKPSNNNSDNSNSNKDNSSNNSGSSHTHSWVNVTKTVNHPAQTHQEDVYENKSVCVKNAYDEQVANGTTAVCNQCGFSTTNPDAMTNHQIETGHSCSYETNYKTVHHDAVYETQRVKTGTKTVTDKEAWTETVVTGQKCSSCGATK